MSIEIKKLLFTLIEKIDEDIIMSSENHEGENQFLLVTLQDKISGMVMGSVSLIHMEI